MKNGIVMLVLILLVIQSAFADEFDDIGQPPSVGAPGSIQGSPPDVQITSPAGGAVASPVTVAVSAVDDGTVAKVELFVDNIKNSEDLTAPYSFSVALAAGDHTLKAVATDNEGLIGESAVVTVSVGATGGGGGADTTAPTVSITSPASGSSVSCTVTVDADASDNVGVDRVELFVGIVRKGTDTAVPYSFQLDTSSMSGSRALKATAFDAAGNKKDSALVTITVTMCGVCNPFESFCDIPDPGGGGGATPDITAPQVAITFPADGAPVQQGILPVTATASDNVGVARVEFYHGTTLKVTDTSSPYGFDFDTTGLPGSQIIKAKAYDAAGNSAEGQITITVSDTAAQQDTIVPVVAITAPTAQATVADPLTVSATATDNVGVTKVDFLLDGNLKGTVTAAPYTLTITAVASGSHTLRAVAQDAAGNTGQNEVTFSVEGTMGGTTSGTTSDGSSSTSTVGSDSRTYRNYPQTRGIKRDKDTDILVQGDPPKIQPILTSPIANPVVPAPRIQLPPPSLETAMLPPQDEPVQLWVILVSSSGVLLVLGLAVAFVVHLLRKKVPADVMSYVRSNIKQGYAPEVLEETLIQQGWSQKVAQRAVSSAQNV